MKISELKQRFEQASCMEQETLFAEYRTDTRPGVIKMLDRYQLKRRQLQKEKERIWAMKEFEHKYCEYSFICGIDEVGRGPLAGPVVAGAVILPKDCSILYLNDSKKLSEAKRESLYLQIMDQAVSVGLGSVSNVTIDEINILNATYEAMRQAIARLHIEPDLLLNDAVVIPKVKIKQVSIIKGDARSLSIAAASVAAKVTRDRLMVEYDKVFPGYGFASNKGYGTADHIAALKKLGPTPIHRKSFISNLYEVSK